MTKVEIICPIHGSFWQLPNNHLQDHGCGKCGITKHMGNFEKTISLDKKKAEWCDDNGWRLVVLRAKGIFSNDPDQFKQNIRTEVIKELNEDIFDN